MHDERYPTDAQLRDMIVKAKEEVLVLTSLCAARELLDEIATRLESLATPGLHPVLIRAELREIAEDIRVHGLPIALAE